MHLKKNPPYNRFGIRFVHKQTANLQEHLRAWVLQNIQKTDFYLVKSRQFLFNFHISSRPVRTCFRSANYDFGGKTSHFNYILNANSIWTKIPQTGHSYSEAGGWEAL